MVGGEKKKKTEEKKTLLLSQSSFSRQFLVCALSCNRAIKVNVRERKKKREKIKEVGTVGEGDGGGTCGLIMK